MTQDLLPTTFLQDWLFAHKKYPYPTLNEKVELARNTNLSLVRLPLLSLLSLNGASKV